MKKTTINLLASRDEYLKIERSLRILHIAVIVYCCLFIVGALSFTFLQYQQSRNIQNLIDQKTTLLASLSNYKDQEAQLVFVAKKVQSYNKFILDDARFLPYYNLLSSALKNTSESSGGTSSAILSSFKIDKVRAVSFTLIFGSVEEMVDSFRYVESEGFLNNFEQLSLNGLTVGAGQTENSLSFSGKFKEIADETSN
jgi:hypothetical protein